MSDRDARGKIDDGSECPESMNGEHCGHYYYDWAADVPGEPHPGHQGPHCCYCDKDREYQPPVLTPMSLSVAEEWPISSAPWLRVRRVGWLDQKGRVWTEIPPISEFDGGSLTPLLIQLEDKFEPPVLTREFLDSLIEELPGGFHGLKYAEDLRDAILESQE
jgi:hypothetical protein